MTNKEALLNIEAQLIGLDPDAMMDSKTMARAILHQGDINRIRQKLNESAYQEMHFINQITKLLPQDLLEAYKLIALYIHSFEKNSKPYFGADYEKSLTENERLCTPERVILEFKPKESAFTKQKPDEANTFLTNQTNIMFLSQYIMHHVGHEFTMRSHLGLDQVISNETGLTFFSKSATKAVTSTNERLRFGVLANIDYLEAHHRMMLTYNNLSNGYEFLQTQGTTAQSFEDLKKKMDAIAPQI